MTINRKIYCCECKSDVIARLTTGKEVCFHRKYLRDVPFWKCDTCNGYIGCHHKSRDRIKPLGDIPTEELKVSRNRVHKILDPMWNNNKKIRKEIYQYLSEELGIEYHTGNIRTDEEAYKVCELLVRYKENRNTC